MKKILAGSLLAATVLGVVMTAGTAGAELRPVEPKYTLVPGFDCGVTIDSVGHVKITKTNAGAVDKTKDVVAVINTPNGKVGAAVCGSAFGGDAVGASASVSFAKPVTKDKDWIYTCTASQTTQTFACNPPK